MRRLHEQVHAGVPHGFKIIYQGSISSQSDKLAEDIAAMNWYTPQEIENMDSDTLRDIDIKQEVADYMAGKSYPLDLVRHTVQK